MKKSKQLTIGWTNKQCNSLVILMVCMAILWSWGCKAGVLSLHNNILLDVVSEASDKEGCSIHDLGCGLGHLANRINNHLASHPMKEIKISGSDISATAIIKAKELKSIDFYVCDIQREVLKEEYDVIVMSEVLWYLLKSLDSSFKNIGSH